MSSGQKAVAEDEDELYELQRQTNLTSYNVRVYSDEARFLKEGYQKYGLKGQYLQEYIDLRKQIDTLIRKQAQENSDYNKYLELKKRFENV